jgi:hypothetical protein
MNHKNQKNSFFPSMEWVVAGGSLLLLITAGGLALFGQRALGPDNWTTALLAFYLASWSYVLGIAGLASLLMWELIGWLRVDMKQAAISRFSSAEPRPRPFEKSPLRVPQYSQWGIAPSAPSRSSGEGNDGKQTHRLTRVA